MKRLFFVLLFATATSNLLAQKTINDPNAEIRTVSSFHGIDVATGIKLILTAGNEEAVAVSASSVEFRERIVTEVVNGVLKIHYDSKLGAINRKREDKRLRAYVSYKTIDRLSVTTGAEVELQGVLTSPSLQLVANTGGLVNGEVAITKLSIDQSTGSKVSLSGTADALTIEGNTGSKFMGEGLKTNTCSASVSTGAGVMINVEKELEAKANTGGYIKYRGQGGIRNLKTHSGGQVSRI